MASNMRDSMADIELSDAMRRHSWRPAQFVISDMMLILYVGISQAFIRSFDYGTGRDRKSPALGLVESAGPLWLWSIGFLVGVLLLAFGRVQRRHLFIWMGHGWLALGYTALAIGLAIPYLGEPPWFDGIRSAGVLLFPIVIHWKLFTRTGPRPVRPREEITTGVEVGRSDC